MNNGYFSISRKIKDNFLYPSNENRKFTKYEAWLWIIENAYFFCKKKIINNKLTIVPRGYLDTTIEQLSQIWKWDKRTVNKYVQMLVLNENIKTFKIAPQKRNSCTLIKVNNYNVFQPIINDKCKLKCKLKCKSYCKLQSKLKCTPYNKDNNINKDNKEKKKRDVFVCSEIDKLFKIYESECKDLLPLKFERRNKEIREMALAFLDEIQDDFSYVRELFVKANKLKEIANNKIDFKMLIKNHIGIDSGKYGQQEESDLFAGLGLD